MKIPLNRLQRQIQAFFPRKLRIAVFFMGSVCVTIWIAFRDVAPPDVRDLMIANPDGVEAVSFEALSNWRISHPLHVSWDAESTAFSQGKGPPADRVVSSILMNRGSLERLENLVGAKGFIAQSAVSSDLIDDIGAAGILLGRSVRLHVHKGDSVGALSDALFLTRLGVVVMRSSTTGSQWELGLVLAGSGLRLCEWCLRNASYTANDMMRIFHLLDWIIAESPDLGLANLAKHEYWALDQFISELASGIHGMDHHVISSLTESRAAVVLARVMFRPNRARARAAMWQREVISLSTRITYVTEEEYASGEFMCMFAAREWWGDRYFGIYRRAVDIQLQVPGFRTPLDLQHERNHMIALIEGIRLLICVLQYEKEHEDLPNSLADLSPRYMDSVPFDPFGGKPFKYDRKKRVVYSLGAKLVDYGGVHRRSTSGEGRFCPLFSDRRNIVLLLVSISDLQ